APERDERARTAPVAALVLVRTRSAGSGVEGVAGEAGECRGGSACLLPPREDEQRGAQRSVRAGDGARGSRGLVRERAAGQLLELVELVRRLDAAHRARP